ncbi:MAG: selenium cofactor biosynthesis protein YqeC [Alphaproteobacteria bacterium]
MDRAAAEALVDALRARSGIVAAVGAGGKKSTLYRLLEAHRALGTRRVLLTSTVQIATPPSGLGVETLIVGADAAIADIGSRDGLWLIAGPSLKADAPKPSRYGGLAEDTIPRLHRSGAFAVTLVKADGARMRMIKAPADTEPALPEGVTTVLPIVSARVFGRPLTEKLAHRPERLCQVIDAEPGIELTPRHVAHLLASPEGGLKRVGSAQVVPVITMVEGAERLAQAQEAARLALAMTERFERVVLASMTGAAPLVDVVTR